jgi:iron only hydrogenase large subunit-like protein
VPELAGCISGTRTPMHYAAEIAKKEYPGCITVFIGPCLAKRQEGMDDELVDYVISIEELGALFVAKEIDVAQVPAAPGKDLPTATGRNFAKSGGVAQAVKARLKDPSILKEAAIDGLNKAGMKRLSDFGKIITGKQGAAADTPNLVEVMACQGGCIGGPSIVTNPKVALMLLSKYAEFGAKLPK